jgi:hypothetical protein
MPNFDGGPTTDDRSVIASVVAYFGSAPIRHPPLSNETMIFPIAE